MIHCIRLLLCCREMTLQSCQAAAYELTEASKYISSGMIRAAADFRDLPAVVPVLTISVVSIVVMA